MVGFAFITVYMVAAASESDIHAAFRWSDRTRSSVYLAVIGIKAAVEDGNIDVADYNNADQTFRNIVLSLIATYGIYILASLLALDPWHMLTSFIQYLLVSARRVATGRLLIVCSNSLRPRTSMSSSKCSPFTTTQAAADFIPAFTPFQTYTMS